MKQWRFMNGWKSVAGCTGLCVLNVYWSPFCFGVMILNFGFEYVDWPAVDGTARDKELFT